MTYPQPTRLHDHPTMGHVVVLHVRDAEEPVSPTNPAHAFGPFASEDEARAWERVTDMATQDTCHRIILDLYEPR